MCLIKGHVWQIRAYLIADPYVCITGHSVPNADYKYLSVSIIFTLGSSVDQFYWGGGGGGGGLGGKDEDG